MKKIKSFTYLDHNKMNSISSQIFEGLTEYVISSKTEQVQQKDQQKGKKNSGHLMADLITNSSSEAEKKFLNDYAYTLFEEALENEGKVLEIDEDSVALLIDTIDDFSFIKIRGRLIFNDTTKVESFLREYNELGYWSGYIAHYEKFKDAFNDLYKPYKVDKSPKFKVRTESEIREAVRRIVDFGNLQQDENLMKGMSYLLNYGYNGGFEIHAPFSSDEYHYLFSSVINREFLKEKEEDIIKKYSRDTEKEFVIFGIPTQTNFEKGRITAYGKGYGGPDSALSIKELMMDLIFRFTDIEKVFFGKLFYEYMIDPIAIYREL